MSKLFNDDQKKFLIKLINEGEVNVEAFSKEIDKSKQTVYNHYHLIKNLLVFERSKGKIRLYWKDETKAVPFFCFFH